ncbi:hypothetical protein T492DRAFT_1073518 [Pavlovales sp. CCMP2436]|nr:hypothetical protein T492DRAFT_1073518 [Pavlovales sp. CCMP2436]
MLVTSEPVGAPGGGAMLDAPAWVRAANGTVSTPLDPYSLVLLRPCVFEVEDQELARAAIERRQAALGKQMPDLWHDNYRSMRNYLVALHSLGRLADLVRAREASALGGLVYDAVLVLRADTVFLCPVDLPTRLPTILADEAARAAAPRHGAAPVLGRDGRRVWVRSSGSVSAGIVAVPLWGRWGGTNDRFAFGGRSAMLDVYLGREGPAWQLLADGSHKRNGEHLLRDLLKTRGVDVRHTQVVVQRFRPIGTGARDIVGMADDSLDYLRDDLAHTVTGYGGRHWVRFAGKRRRNTTREEICRLSRKAVEGRGTWATARTRAPPLAAVAATAAAGSSLAL